MTEAKRGMLPYVRKLKMIELLYLFQQCLFPLLLQVFFQFIFMVKVVLYRPFGLAGNDHHFLDAELFGFLHSVLDHRLVYNGQHLFW